MIGFMNDLAPFIKSNPLYDVTTKQHFADEEIKFEPVLNVLELLFSHVAFGNYFINVIDFRDFTYPYNSPSCEAITGFKAIEVPSLQQLIHLIHPDDLPIFLEYGGQAMGYINNLPLENKKRAMFNHCFRMRRKDTNQYTWLYQQHHMSYIDGNGSIVYSISLITDVTPFYHSKTRPTWCVTEHVRGSPQVYHIGSNDDDDDEMYNRVEMSFSNRELDILRLSSKGYTSKEIALQLGISYQTVLTHRKNVLKKSKSKSMAEAIAFALQMGLFSL